MKDNVMMDGEILRNRTETEQGVGEELRKIY
jgi:hypothetical protein